MRQNQALTWPKASFWLGVLGVVAGAIALSLLAHWQYQRAHYKTELEAKILSQLDKPAASRLQQTLPAWQKVQVSGRFDSRRNVLLEHQRYNGQTGWRLLTPLVLPDGKEIIVDRGWQAYPANRLNPDFAALAQPEQVVEVMAVVRKFPQRKGGLGGPITNTHPYVLLFLDAAYILEHVSFWPFYVQAMTPTHPAFVAALSELPSPAKHWEYMLTWLALLVAWVGIGVAALRANYRA